MFKKVVLALIIACSCTLAYAGECKCNPCKCCKSCPGRVACCVEKCKNCGCCDACPCSKSCCAKGCCGKKACCDKLGCCNDGCCCVKCDCCKVGKRCGHRQPVRNVLKFIFRR